MQSTAAIGILDKLAQPTNGRPATHSAEGPEFLAALNKLVHAALAGSVVPTEATLHDTIRPAPAGDPIPQPPADRTPYRGGKPEENPIPAEQNRATDERPRDTAAMPVESVAPVESEQKQTERPEHATPQNPVDPKDRGEPYVALPTADAQRGSGSSSAVPQQQGQVRTATSPAQPHPVQPVDAETPPPSQAAPQPGNRNGNTGQSQITAQVTNAADRDHLPQIGHTLSSRSALVAQSDAAKTGPSGDPAAKFAPADGTATSLVAGTAQPNAQAAKAKGQNKPGNNNTAGTTAAAANGAQNAATQAGQAAANAPSAALPLQQQRLAATAARTGEGLNAGMSQTGGARSEPFTLGGNGQTASQFGTHRTDAPAQAPKSPPPVPARVVAHQVAVQIQKAFGNGSDRISIQLKPAELGRVEVRLDMGHHGHVSAVITADRADTLDLLQRDARILQNALQDAGLQADSDSLTFELKNQEQAFNPSSDGGGTGEGSNEESGVAEAAALRAQQNVVTDDRIDIRV